MKINSEYIKLIKNIGVLILLGIGISLLIAYFSSDEDDYGKIADTPIRVEKIRKIAEIATVSYSDEIVVDSIEFYDEMDEMNDWFDAYEITQRIVQRNVKRRLTLIVKGDVKFGFDLKSEQFETKRRNDTLEIYLPEPRILEVLLTPSGTEVYQEQGTWKDRERQKLEMKAKLKLIENASSLDLVEKSREAARKLFKRLLQHEKHVEIHFRQ